MLANGQCALQSHYSGIVTTFSDLARRASIFFFGRVLFEKEKSRHPLVSPVRPSRQLVFVDCYPLAQWPDSSPEWLGSSR